MFTICRDFYGVWAGIKYRSSWLSWHYSTECGLTVVQVGPVIVEWVRK